MAMEPEASGELDGRFVLFESPEAVVQGVSGKDGVSERATMPFPGEPRSERQS